MERITDFHIGSGFLSNFAHSPIEVDSITYATVEHAYQASKTHDIQQRITVASEATPGRAKRAGRRVTMRSDWQDVSVDVMTSLLRKKFALPGMKRQLLATGDAELVEGNHWHDNVWGSCTCDRCKHIEGRNQLGKALMTVRSELRVEKSEPVRFVAAMI